MTPVSRPGADDEGRNPSGAEIAGILRGTGLAFETLEPDRRWRLSFAGHHHPTVEVYVLYSETFTVVLGRLGQLGADAGVDVYRRIARRNYDMEQLKLSVDKDGQLFASFEVPTRILDRRELLENILALAAALDTMDLSQDPDDAPAEHVVPAPAPAPAAPPEDTESPLMRIRAPSAWSPVPASDVL